MIVEVLWSSRNGAVVAEAQGRALIAIHRITAAQATILESESTGTTAGQASANFVGVYIDGSNIAHLVFFVGDNGTSTSQGRLNVTVMGVENAITLTLGATATDRGTSNPSTSKVLINSKTWDPPNVAAAGSTTTTVTVTGVALGDPVTRLSFSLDLQGQTLTGYVSAADTVTVVLFNSTAGALNLGSGTLYVAVGKKNFQY
jgi:hypothetical protein